MRVRGFFVYTGDNDVLAKATPPIAFDLVPGQVLTIGRVAANAICLYNSGVTGPLKTVVSRHHARLSLSDCGGEVLLEDLNAVNGTYINRVRTLPLVPTPLVTNDTITLGGGHMVPPGSTASEHRSCLIEAFQYRIHIEAPELQQSASAVAHATAECAAQTAASDRGMPAAPHPRNVTADSPPRPVVATGSLSHTANTLSSRPPLEGAMTTAAATSMVSAHTDTASAPAPARREDAKALMLQAIQKGIDLTKLSQLLPKEFGRLMPPPETSTRASDGAGATSANSTTSTATFWSSVAGQKRSQPATPTTFPTHATTTVASVHTVEGGDGETTTAQASAAKRQRTGDGAFALPCNSGSNAASPPHAGRGHRGGTIYNTLPSPEAAPAPAAGCDRTQYMVASEAALTNKHHSVPTLPASESTSHPVLDAPSLRAEGTTMTAPVAGSPAGGTCVHSRGASTEADALRNAFICFLCRSCPHNPVLTRCGHLSCRACVERQLTHILNSHKLGILQSFECGHCNISLVSSPSLRKLYETLSGDDGMLQPISPVTIASVGRLLTVDAPILRLLALHLQGGNDAALVQPGGNRHEKDTSTSTAPSSTQSSADLLTSCVLLAQAALHTFTTNLKT